MPVKELGRLALRVVEEADARVGQHVDQHVVDLVVLDRVEEADEVEECQLRSCQHTRLRKMLLVCIGRRRDVRAVCTRCRVIKLRAHSPEVHGQRAAQRDGRPALTVAEGRASVARSRRLQQRGGRASSDRASRLQAVVGPKRWQRACGEARRAGSGQRAAH